MSTKFIAIEGLDGCGKETQAKLLEKYLTDQGYKVVMISFPRYGEPSCSLVEMYLNGDISSDPNDVNPYAAAMCYSLDRYISFKTDWCKYATGDYDYVIFDRYMSSNVTHQANKLNSKDRFTFISWLQNTELVKFGLPTPNLEIYLTVDPMCCMDQMNNRSKLDIHENLDYQIGVYNTLMDIKGYLPHYSRFLDCMDYDNKKLYSIENIHDKILGMLRENELLGNN